MVFTYQCITSENDTRRWLILFEAWTVVADNTIFGSNVLACQIFTKEMVVAKLLSTWIKLAFSDAAIFGVVWISTFAICRCGAACDLTFLVGLFIHICCIVLTSFDLTFDLFGNWFWFCGTSLSSLHFDDTTFVFIHFHLSW